MRTGFAVLGVVALLAVSGCNEKEDVPTKLPPVTVAQVPAASAGGACILWDWGFIEEKIGVQFGVAASDQVDDTSTCVVQTVSGSWPDLSVSVVEQTKADAKIFLAERMPKKAVKLKGLGKAAYRLNGAATGGHGPTVEIGWLSEAEQLQTLKFTFAKGASKATVTQMNAKLLDLAKAMDTTDG
ncbi:MULTISPECIES: hypothetical protein [Actinoplanes]|uniref:DUF3558 domain-containing protein n=2 Tax=Actinoplanes TaxID=1865 RepID=A0A0X3UTL8_9ACTN|nr:MULTISPECIES: hypothetical protein [Actinoplanes]KUL35825.1 hypothetical protein ADL15_13760 [Actinoplanes awajinensis subsp. mycoplanecinus]GIE65709.1 hypothetical protein Apa02nite_018170 [Actinoplanes palleronii]